MIYTTNYTIRTLLVQGFFLEKPSHRFGCCPDFGLQRPISAATAVWREVGRGQERPDMVIRKTSFEEYVQQVKGVNDRRFGPKTGVWGHFEALP